MDHTKKCRSPDAKKIFCCYCGRWIVFPLRHTIEHLIPLSNGGNNRKANKRDCCHRCNHKRHNTPLSIWLCELKKANKRVVNDEITKTRIKNIEKLIIYIDTNKEFLLKDCYK